MNFPPFVSGDAGVRRCAVPRTPLPGVCLCSVFTPPGPSVHGMCGRTAALSALRRHHGLRTSTDLFPKEKELT